MVATGDTEHSSYVEKCAHRNRCPAPSAPKCEDASEVDRPEHSLLYDVNKFWLVGRGCIALEHGTFTEI